MSYTAPLHAHACRSTDRVGLQAYGNATLGPASRALLCTRTKLRGISWQHNPLCTAVYVNNSIDTVVVEHTQFSCDALGRDVGNRAQGVYVQPPPSNPTHVTVRD